MQRHNAAAAEAAAKAANAISFASTYHSEWFWSGVESQ